MLGNQQLRDTFLVVADIYLKIGISSYGNDLHEVGSVVDAHTTVTDDCWRLHKIYPKKWRGLPPSVVSRPLVRCT